MNVPPYLQAHVPFLQQNLSSLRFQHVLNVMHEMGNLAEIYQVHREQAMTAGLLHDTAREMSADEMRPLVQEAKITIDHPCEHDPLYLHGPVGAYLAQKQFGVTAAPVLEAIRVHSTFAQTADMDFAWCLRFADLLAPSRPWLGMKKFKSVVYAGRVQEARLLQTKWLIDYLIEQEIPVHPNMEFQFRELCAQVPADENFFEKW